jgi:hypothetical protein
LQGFRIFNEYSYPLLQDAVTISGVPDVSEILLLYILGLRTPRRPKRAAGYLGNCSPSDTAYVPGK